MDNIPSKLVDVSWRFGVTAATSESDFPGKSFVQMALYFHKDNETRNVFTEMSVTEFYKFLQNLEKAKNDIELLL